MDLLMNNEVHNAYKILNKYNYSHAKKLLRDWTEDVYRFNRLYEQKQYLEDRSNTSLWCRVLSILDGFGLYTGYNLELFFLEREICDAKTDCYESYYGIINAVNNAKKQSTSISESE